MAQLHEGYVKMMMIGTVGGWRWNFEMNTDSSVTIVTGLRAGRQKNQASIANRGKTFLSTAQGGILMCDFSILGGGDFRRGQKPGREDDN